MSIQAMPQETASLDGAYYNCISNTGQSLKEKHRDNPQFINNNDLFLERQVGILKINFNNNSKVTLSFIAGIKAGSTPEAVTPELVLEINASSDDLSQEITRQFRAMAKHHRVKSYKPLPAHQKPNTKPFTLKDNEVRLQLDGPDNDRKLIDFLSEQISTLIPEPIRLVR